MKWIATSARRRWGKTRRRSWRCSVEHWNTTLMGCQAQAILPNDQALHVLSAYLQQAEMESNGKSVSGFGEEVDYQTVPLIWDPLGIDGQHAFYQYLHQGKRIVPADFIGSLESLTSLQDQHEVLLSNLFAQTRALMLGVEEAKVREEVRARLKSTAWSRTRYIRAIAPPTPCWSTKFAPAHWAVCLRSMSTRYLCRAWS